MSFHQIVIVGNAGADAEMRFTPSGKAVASFSVAANHEYTDGQGEKVKQVYWFRITTWGKLAEICNQYVKKGMKVLVVGRMNADPNTGGPKLWGEGENKKASYDVTAETVRFLSRSEGVADSAHDAGNVEYDSELPF